MGGTVGRDNSDMTFLGNLRDKLRSRRKSTHRRTGTGILAGSSSQASDTPSSGVTDGPGGPVKLSREGHQLASPVVPPVDLEPIEASRVNNGTARADADTQAPITDSVASTTRSEGTQATDVPSPAAPPAVPPTEQSLPSETDVPGLWDAAYDRLGAENPDLLRRYEEMLSGYLGQGDEPGPDPRRPSVTTISPGHHDGETAYHDALARRAKTTRVMRIWLDGLGKREGAEVGSGERAAPALIIAALRKTVLGASESAPHAAVAWAAMCLAAEALFHPPSEAGMAHSDILYVASRMGWYISLSRLLSAAGNESPSLDGASKPERQHLESTIADLYHSVLSFEIGIAACFPQGSGDHRKHYDRIRELESALATSFGGTQIESLLRQLAKLAQEERDAPREEGKETDEDGDDDEATEQEEVRAMMDGLAAAKPEDTIPSPRDAERQILKPLYDGIIAPKQEYREFLDAAYESERGQLQGRLLWINGAAGSGKTMLMQAIVERLLSQRSEPPKTPCNTSIRPGTLSYFFCNNSERGPEDAVSVLRSLLWQVLDAQPFSKRHLLEKGRSTDRTSFDGPNDFYALSEVFSRIVQDAEFTTTFFAVDAIDDLDEDASGLCDLLGLIVATAKMQPRKVRWLMSTTCGTRGDGLVSDCLVATPGGPLPLGLNLDLQVEGLDTAFNKYMSLKIDELPKLASYEGSFRESITSMLRTNSNVNFLWVSLACQIIEATGTPWTALATLNALPSGARALYKHMRDEIASRRWDSNHCNHVLDTAAVACRPLDIRELRDLRELPREIDVNILVDRICYPFLKVRNNTIYFTHRYAKQVLREHMGQKLSAAHAKMTELCLEKALVGTSSRISTKYAAIYWARHLAKVRDDDGHHGGGAVTGDGDGPGHEAMKAATHFLKRHFLPWVETLASTKLLHQALGELERLERVLRGPPRCDISRQCLDAVREAVLFLRFHESSGIPADTSPQLRLLGVRSAALFWPATGSMKTRLVREACPWISHAFSSEDELDAMVQTLRGHDDWARCCSYSAGGRLVASAADDSTVRVWDAETGSAQRVFPVDDERSPARRVVFSPRRGPLGDSELLAASTSSIIKIWDVITGNLRVELKSPQMRPEGGDNYVGDIGFSPDGKTLAVAIDESLMTVDLETLEATEWPQPGGEKTDESVRRVVYAQKAPLLATSQGRVISLWDCGTRKVLRRLAKHDRAIDGLAFSPDSRFLASGADDETVRVWSVDSGQELRVFSLHTSYVNSVSFSPDGTRVASASHDATVRIWTAQSGWDRGQVGQPPVTTTVLTGHRRAIQWVTFSPSGERIASASNDATVRVWDSNVGRPEMVPEGGGATTGENGGDASGPVRARRRRCHTGAVAVLAFSPPDGKTLASGCEDGMVCLWDGETGGHLQALVANEEGPATFRSRRITSLVFSPSGEMLVSTSADRHARVWDVASGNLKWSLGDHRDWVRGAAVSPDERLVASACDDRCVRLWDLAADSPPESPITLRGHSDYVYSVAFSADNRYLGSAGDDCRVLVWDLATAKGEDSKPDKILDPGVGPLRSIVFTPDGARLLASSGDGTISLWDVKTGLLVRQGQAGQGAKFGGALALQMDGQHPDDVVTQLGTWPLARLGLGLQDLERPLPPLWSPIGLGEDGCWITWKKRDLVFIPKQCRGRSGRPAATRFQGYKAAVGCESGQVVLLNFKQGVEPVFEDGL